LRRAGKGGGVEHEDIILHEIPLVEAAAWLEKKARTGALIDPKVYAGLFFATTNLEHAVETTDDTSAVSGQPILPRRTRRTRRIE
jgi:hypothetical protein